MINARKVLWNVHLCKLFTSELLNSCQKFKIRLLSISKFIGILNPKLAKIFFKIPIKEDSHQTIRNDSNDDFVQKYKCFQFLLFIK